MEVELTKSAIGDAKRRKCISDETLTLPDSIIMYEILVRLPVKSLIRFQSVSKYWFSTISQNPDFAELYFKFSSLFRRYFFVWSIDPFFGANGGFFSLPYQECSVQKNLYNLGYAARIGWCDILGSCNGLVCLYHFDDEMYKENWEREQKCCFELWNPATKASNEIYSPPGVHIGLAYGFGYVPSLDDYKIVCFFGTVRKIDAAFRGFYVFSLRSGKWQKKFSCYDYSSKHEKWRRIRNCSDEDLAKEGIVKKLDHRNGILNDGTLYWAPGYSSGSYIIGFDLESEEFRECTSMDWKQGYYSVELFRMKGCLALHGRKSNEVSEIWMLKDSDDWGTWQKLFF